MADSSGHVIQVTGPVVDVQFVGGKIPPIDQAQRVVVEGKHDEIPEQAFCMQGQDRRGTDREQKAPPT